MAVWAEGIEVSEQAVLTLDYKAVIPPDDCHTPPPGLAFGEPDDRLLRGIQYAAAPVVDRAAGVNWIIRSSLSSGAHSRDPLADDDMRA